MDIGNQPAIEPGNQPFLHALQIRRRFVRRNHNLAALVDQGVEGVEKFFLGGILAADELDVIDHQHINGAELVLEIHRILFTQRADEPVHELFRRKIDDVALRRTFMNMPGNSVHQMGLAEADAAIQKQRIELCRGGLGDAPGGGIGKFVGLADDEVLKVKTPVQRSADVAGGAPHPVVLGFVDGRGRAVFHGAGRRFAFGLNENVDTFDVGVFR